MLAFNSDVALKEFIVSGLRAHRDADAIVKDTYWERGKGCAVGCTLENVRKFRKDDDIDHASHQLYEKYLGVPSILARLEDRIFKGLPNNIAKDWPLRFVSVITPGSALSEVWPKFAAWLLADPEKGAIRFCKTDEQREILQRVADSYLVGEKDREVWAKIRAKAWEIRQQAYAAAYAAADAAVARQNQYIAMADKLEELLKAAK